MGRVRVVQPLSCVHVGFTKLDGAKGIVDPSLSGKGKLIDINVTIDKNLSGKSLEETIAHEGTHVGDDMKFFTTYDFSTGKYDSSLNITHGQTEFNAYQNGAVVTHEHGFGPNHNQKILNCLHHSPVYG